MPFDAEQARHTLATILRTQGDVVAAEVLETAHAEISYNGEDFGSAIYSFDLKIPTVRFAQLEPEIGKIVGRIEKKLWKLQRDHENGSVNTVRIYPAPSVGKGAIAVQTPTHSDETRIWVAGRVRLFISHVSRIKVPASSLKNALAPLGIDSFVAHEDIQPTIEWHREIEFALRSMDVLCALITEDFVKSEWTDQEVGFALGRGVPVIAIACGATPYGLLGKHQALRADLNRLAETATRVTDIIAAQEHLRARLTAGLVDELANTPTFQRAKESMKRLSALSAHLTEAQIRRLLEAERENSQVREAHGVPTQIHSIAKGRNVSLPSAEEIDDDIPF